MLSKSTFLFTLLVALRAPTPCNALTVAVKPEIGTVLVFGASKGVGKEVVRLTNAAAIPSVGMSRPTRVMMPSNNPSPTPPTACWSGVTAPPPTTSDGFSSRILGNVCSIADVQACFDAVDGPIAGVIVTLGGDADDVGNYMLSVGTHNVVQCMHRNHVRRIAVVTSVGIGNSSTQAPLSFKRRIDKRVLADKTRQEAVFTSDTGPGGSLEWCVVRPGKLTDGAPNRAIVTPNELSANIPRVTVAGFCLDFITAAVDVPPYLRQTPVIQGMCD